MLHPFETALLDLGHGSLGFLFLQLGNLRVNSFLQLLALGFTFFGGEGVETLTAPEQFLAKLFQFGLAFLGRQVFELFAALLPVAVIGGAEPLAFTEFSDQLLAFFRREFPGSLPQRFAVGTVSRWQGIFFSPQEGTGSRRKKNEDRKPKPMCAIHSFAANQWPQAFTHP